MTDGTLLETFVTRGDAAAFEKLVQRHGPLVFRVCRDVLADHDEAEDAFQATFLVLVRRASSIRNVEAIGPWLHATAHRIAVRAKVHAKRRRARERQGAEMTKPRADSQPERAELRPIDQAELARLPEGLRAPMVLCYLEGRTYDDAAAALGLPLGTLKGRLSRARELLRSRLTRRGVAVSAMLLLLLLTEDAEAVPAELSQATVNSMTVLHRRGHLPESLPIRVSELVEGEARRATLKGLALVGILALLGVLGTLSPPLLAREATTALAHWSQPKDFLTPHACEPLEARVLHPSRTESVE